MSAAATDPVERLSVRHATLVPIPIEAPEAKERPRLPPYGREVLGELAKGRKPNVYIFAGAEAWSLAEGRRTRFGIGTALVAPANESPAAFAWPRLDACFVDARNIPRIDAVKLGAAILGAGTRFVALIGPNDEPMAFRRST